MDHPASSAAVLGRPTPMNTLSAWLQPPRGYDRLDLGGGRRASCGGQSAGAQHVLVHPLGEAFPVSAELVPEPVEVVVAVGDPEAVGRLRAARRHRHEVDRPAGDDDPAGPELELLDLALDRDQRALRPPARPPSARRGSPTAERCPARSTSWAWTIATSGLSAGTAVSSSPVNGQVRRRDGRVLHQVGADVPAHDRAGQVRGAGGVAVGHARRGCAPRARSRAASRSRSRRGSGAASQRRDCRRRRRPGAGTRPGRSSGRTGCPGSSGSARARVGPGGGSRGRRRTGSGG